MQLALALYNNKMDDDDELEFRKGDILTVLIENPTGFEGWWLCKLNERCGLCPANRLKLIQDSVSSPVKSRLSTASMYDDLSNNNEYASNHDYDNQYESDFILTSTKNLHIDELDEMENLFKKLFIRSKLIDRYRQILLKRNIQSINDLFIKECHAFLDDYGFLLDRHTYRLIKQKYLIKLENEKQQIIDISTKIIQIIKSIIETRENKKQTNFSSISNDSLRKLHLEPIEEVPNEKMNQSLSTTQIYGNFHIKNTKTKLSTSKTCQDNFLSFSSNNTNDYIDVDYKMNPLVKCYYRHINEHVDLIEKHYSHLIQMNNQTITMLLNDGKALTIAGHKLLFVLETFHEHSQQKQTQLFFLTKHLCETLTNLIQLLKKLTRNRNKILIDYFQEDIRIMFDIVTKIKQICTVN